MDYLEDRRMSRNRHVFENSSSYSYEEVHATSRANNNNADKFGLLYTARGSSIS